jgi:hypothetical protein
MPIIPARGWLRQEDHQLEATLGYIARAYLKDKRKRERKGQIIKNS